jgi:hypothetical protein
MKVNCIFANNNEWTRKWDTFVGIVGSVEVDLTKQHTLLVSNDNWMQYEVNKYQVKELNLPEWLYNGLLTKTMKDNAEYIGQVDHNGKVYTEETLENDVLNYTIRITAGDTYGKHDAALHSLSVSTSKNKYYDSLKTHFSEKGFLSGKQIDCILYPKWKKRGA